MSVRILRGDCREVLRSLPDESVHAIVTSPPYWGLRDYGTAKWEGGDAGCDHKQSDRNESDRRMSTLGGGVATIAAQDAGSRAGQNCRKCGARRVDSQLGLEPTPQEYVEHMVGVFREARRVLRADGTLWLNLGDSYAGSGRGGHVSDTSTLEGSTETEQQSRIARGSQLPPGFHTAAAAAAAAAGAIGRAWVPPPRGLKQKDLVGIPWRVAFALQADGWYLRQDIIWAKPNPMPESVRDRCTKAHEYLFLLTKSERYFFDAAAIAEPCVVGDNGSSYTDPRDEATKPGLGKGPRKQRKPAGWDTGEGAHGTIHRDGRAQEIEYTDTESTTRNKRSVWTVATQGYAEAHFATFPPALIEPCILAGCPADGTVLDPFGGAGTTGLVADRTGRSAILIELNPEYAAMAERRIRGDAPLFAEVAAA